MLNKIFNRSRSKENCSWNKGRRTKTLKNDAFFDQSVDTPKTYHFWTNSFMQIDCSNDKTHYQDDGIVWKSHLLI